MITSQDRAGFSAGPLQRVYDGILLMLQELELKLGRSLHATVTWLSCGTPGPVAIGLHLNLSETGESDEAGLWATVDSVDLIPTLHQHIEVLLLE